MLGAGEAIIALFESAFDVQSVAWDPRTQKESTS